MRTFALAGNPNSGKTTLFNALTGSTAHVGNWPGVTVDKREGVYKGGKEHVAIVDLPGIYSLSPYTPEEVIARNFILNEHPDGIINIVDATNLERNLYLTTQLLEMDVPVIIALNMMERGRKIGRYGGRGHPRKQDRRARSARFGAQRDGHKGAYEARGRDAAHQKGRNVRTRGAIRPPCRGREVFIFA